jgi:hypothetical protein
VQRGCHSPFRRSGKTDAPRHRGHAMRRRIETGPDPGRPTAPRSSAGRPYPAGPASASIGGRGRPCTIAPAANRHSAESTAASRSVAAARARSAEAPGDGPPVPLVPHWGRAAPSWKGPRRQVGMTDESMGRETTAITTSGQGIPAELPTGPWSTAARRSTAISSGSGTRPSLSPCGRGAGSAGRASRRPTTSRA